MSYTREPLPPFLAEPTRIGEEISVTGKWVPSRPGRLFRKSPDSVAMLTEWEDIHSDARADSGLLSTEINHAVGEDAVLVHHVFESADALAHYFSTTATRHMGALLDIAVPQIHLVRGVALQEETREAVLAKKVPAVFANHIYGFVKKDYERPDPAKAIQVTAKWTCKPGMDALDELEHWWQRVGTDAFTLEEGLIRFEVYRVIGENAVIIQETFRDTRELRFHLAKGTAAKYKKDIDKIASPDCYFFRGPVSWDIRTYSRFLALPATYSSQGSNHTRPGGNLSDGLISSGPTESSP